MKILKSFMAVLLMGTVLMACHKDSDNSETPPPASSGIEGKYSGKYGFDDEVPSGVFKLNIKPGGVFQELGSSSGNPTGEGTWKLNGNKLTANYYMLFAPYNEYSVALVYSATNKKLSGTWGYDKSTTDGGKVEVTKAN